MFKNNFDYEREKHDFYDVQGVVQYKQCAHCHKKYKTKFPSIEYEEMGNGKFYDVCPYCHHVNNDYYDSGDMIMMTHRPINIREED